MYQRTTIVLPPGVKEMATTLAKKQGISFSEFVRRSVETAVKIGASPSRAKADPFFSDRAVFRGRVPIDTAVRHDDYLYDDEERD